VILASIFAFRETREKIERGPEVRVERARLGQQDPRVNLDLRALPDPRGPREDKYWAWILPSLCWLDSASSRS
jgi:hypothetical protein